jgi:UDP-GlcNAc3NAcA epimerase
LAIRIMTIVGARPQFIKAAAISRAIAACDGVVELMVHTGQHYDVNMSDLFFEELGIPAPALHLGVGSGQHGKQTGRMMAGIEQAVLSEKPDWVLVFGDTNSTLAGALAAAKLNVKVAHVEAGLRSFNRRMPEEINRVLTDHASDLLFAPTVEAVANLAREGISGDHVCLVGDVMYDVALDSAGRAGSHAAIRERLGVAGRDYIVATVHRAENTDEPQRLAAIAGGFAAASRETPVVLPLHPRTRARLAEAGIETPHGVVVTDPLGYLDLTALVLGARLVATDSGGLQKEAFFHGVPCVTLREETEWVELVELGWNRLLPPGSAEAVAAGLRSALAQPKPQRPSVSPYGDGTSAKKIVERLAGHA